VVERDLKSGALVRLLPDDPLPIAHATALYPRSKVSSRALRVLLDHLCKRSSSDNLAQASPSDVSLAPEPAAKL